MASSARSIISLITLLFLVGGTFASIMLILDDNEIVQDLWGRDFYKISAAFSACFAVIVLLYLTATSTDKSTAYKTMIIFVLIFGLVAELVITLIPMPLQYYDYGKYALVSFNFLYRAYYLLGYIQEPWAALTLKTVNDVVATPATTTSTASAGMTVAEFKAKWGELKGQARLKYQEGINNNEGENIINAAVSAGDLTKAKLSEAVGALKTKSGEPVSGITVGGRRKTRR